MAGVARVAVLSYHSSPLIEPGSGDAGGMTVYIRELASALADQGIQTDIFTRATGDLPRVASLAEGIRCMSIEAGPHEDLPKAEQEAFIDQFAIGIRNFAISQRLRYDLVHSHYWQSGLAAVQLSAWWGIPMVHSHHTLGHVKNRWLAPGDDPEPEERLRGESDVIDEAHVLIASTEEESDQLAGLYGAATERLKVLPPGVDHQVFEPGDRGPARAELGLGDEPILLCVGRIQPLKGMDLAIEALARLEGSPAARLLVVGGASGPRGREEAARLRSIANDLGLEGRVDFVGQQPHARLPLYYQAADCLIVSSHSESFGLAALEAQACGLPVVGARVGGLPHFVKDGNTGFLIDDRDASVLAARLKVLLDDPELRAEFGRAARAGSESFSWKKTAEVFLELYECLVREQFPEACTC
ncbi:MAG TPA: glycosyltransferase [Actinomycetota bacterium]|nr:glycosyltransferase [Actinomycetota bacterium]